MGRIAIVGATLIAPLVLAAASPAGDAREDFRAFLKEHGVAVREYQDRLAELKEKDQPLAEFRRMWDPTPAFLEQAAEKAAEHAGTDGALPFLLWIVESDVPEEKTPDAVPARTEKALAILASAHSESEQLLGSVRYATGWVPAMSPARCAATLERLAALAKHETLRDWCRVGALSVRLDDASLTDAQRAAARKSLEEVARASQAPGLAADVEGLLFERDHLQIGCVAPDIEGADLDGTRFKLSDYRGKVVVVDFWGDW